VSEALQRIPDTTSDATLIMAVRRGDSSAYGLLYERHLSAAKRAAACLATTPSEREDLVAEAFTRVLQTLRSGRGPHEEFRPYLLVTMRHLAINTARRTPVTALFADVPDTFLPAGDDPVAARLYGSDAAHAFAGLPERWRVVLWHT
jgi:DNA-directed RNA polymerase specialized sigma24 family protein